MFTAVQYRAKAIEYAARVKTARSPSETREFQNLEQTYTSLADNAEWLASDFDQPMPTALDELTSGSASAAEERMLGCLGAAVIMRWGTLPAKVQRELFECATSLGDLQQTAQMKGQIARFLHLHKSNAKTPAI
jgi:hypothetical protein